MDNLSSLEKQALKAALDGMVSGELKEWPYMLSACEKLGLPVEPSTRSSTIAGIVMSWQYDRCLKCEHKNNYDGPNWCYMFKHQFDLCHQFKVNAG